jgi:hypothetical protein
MASASNPRHITIGCARNVLILIMRSQHGIPNARQRG